MPDAIRLAEEKKALGFYMTSHPLPATPTLLQALATHQVADLASVGEKTEVVLGGMVVGLRSRTSRRSRDGLTRMAKMTFEDLTGSTPAMMWPSEFAKFESILKDDFIGFARGTSTVRESRPSSSSARSSRSNEGPPSFPRG